MMSDILDIMQHYPCDGDCKFTSGLSSQTLVYYMPIYDKGGVNTNPDRNIRTAEYSCVTCQKQYTVSSQYGSETKVYLRD